MSDTDIDTWIKLLEGGTPAGRAMAVALRYGQIDGDHHKTWVIDQMLRLLAGEEGYGELRRLYEKDGVYEWDEGIAP